MNTYPQKEAELIEEGTRMAPPRYRARYENRELKVAKKVLDTWRRRGVVLTVKIVDEAGERWEVTASRVNGELTHFDFHVPAVSQQALTEFLR